MSDERQIIWLEELTREDVALVGGKNASLGEMIRELSDEGIRVPGGFAVTARAYRDFIEHNDLDEVLAAELEAFHSEEKPLAAAGHAIRRAIAKGEFPPELDEAIRDAYREMVERTERENVDVAIRSSATAEDLPEASFAGQQETYLNVSGADAVVHHVRLCFASLYTDRAITYREHHGFEHSAVSLSASVQLMVRSDTGAAGVAFTLDTETGFPDVVMINGAWGLGETVVKGTVTPDEYRVFKPLLKDRKLAPILGKRRGRKEQKMIYTTGGTTTVETTPEEREAFVLEDEQILRLARWCARIEEHYGQPMDIEWAVDGRTDELFVVQARPETVRSREGATIDSYTLTEEGESIVEGVAVGSAISTGKAFVLESMDDADRFEDGGILIADMTDPDWVPIMKRSSGVITNHGGRTSHAAIVSRELGVAAIVGAENATTEISDGQTITMSCAEGPVGKVYDGELAFDVQSIDFDEMPEIDTRVMLNVADPDAAMKWWRLPVKGIGLARLEFVIEHQVKVHPMALVNFDDLDHATRTRVDSITAGYNDKKRYFVDTLAEGVATIAASQWPEPVVVRMSDFKTNEYAGLVGGASFEPKEDNPMIGFRGASRYHSAAYREGFGLECKALSKVRDEMGFTNVVVMIPFCRTLEEADLVLGVMAAEGLERGVNDLEVYVMAEIPSNIILATEFAERFDGFSIGSNDLTQLTLGIDRDNGALSDLFDERNPAVKRSISELIARAHAAGRHVGICGQAPSDHPDFATFLVDEGIDAISLNPDSVLDVIRRIAEREAELGEG